MNCSTDGVTVAHVPWARHGADHTSAFDGTLPGSSPTPPRRTLVELMRLPWRTVGAIVERMVADSSERHVTPSRGSPA